MWTHEVGDRVYLVGDGRRNIPGTVLDVDHDRGGVLVVFDEGVSMAPGAWCGRGEVYPVVHVTHRRERFYVPQYHLRRLTVEQVQAIRTKASQGLSYGELGRQYNVSAVAISKIVRGETYRDVA